MNKFLLILLSLCLSLTAHAVELEGVKLPDTVHLGKTNMVLNGAGVRSKFVFDLYIVALYLGAKRSSADGVLADAGEKRIALYLLRKVNAEDLLWGFHSALENNHSDEELSALAIPQDEFDMIFHKLRNAYKDDVITLDYQPGIGTQVSVNGVLRGTIPGAAFYNALLKIWLGDQPAQDDLKLKLLGGR